MTINAGVGKTLLLAGLAVMALSPLAYGMVIQAKHMPHSRVGRILLGSVHLAFSLGVLTFVIRQSDTSSRLLGIGLAAFFMVLSVTHFTLVGPAGRR
jgi:uncharacterized membrane protein